ncbi:YihY/virulence factor BrkB family protein [Streptomyces sp. TRM 70361]|uniref:YihY/virulence factor BrkB family protein n=1 Tax=Streptomyces sp. TRM 70361 TaxID=3116553 RepID=UPI002E7C20AA|nr:YihY/virulence factor BrkB family protein [Streptomyces sp. TRM 70361]MEE1938899.1 YihY/virulence factor BrkB family protein [Streptomyces sp. TRM 70361]
MSEHENRRYERGESGGGPQKPADLPKKSWKDVLKRTGAEFKGDNLMDWAAALTYYAVLSIFPALLALVSILGVIGRSAIQPLIDNISTLAPGAARDILLSMLRQLQNNQGAAGLALIIGIALAVWSASGYVAAFMRASNAVYDIEEGRPIWMTLPLRVGITLALLVLLAVSSVAVVFTGGLAQRAGDVLGLGDTFLTVWSIAKWPVLVLLVAFMIALLYWAAPNVKRRFRWISPGSLLAVLLWMVASAGFALYVANFGNYNKTYGSLAGVIIFLIWLWITNIVILLGQEFNAEIERGRAIRGGHPPDEEPYVEPRDTRKFSEDNPEGRA